MHGLLDVGEQFVVRGVSHSGLTMWSPSPVPALCPRRWPACQRGLECHPPQQRALDPGGILRHPGERDAVADQFLVALDGAPDWIISVNAATVFNASPTLCPMTWSASTEVAA